MLMAATMQAVMRTNIMLFRIMVRTAPESCVA